MEQAAYTIRQYEQDLAHAQQSGNRQKEASTLNNLGIAYAN